MKEHEGFEWLVTHRIFGGLKDRHKTLFKFIADTSHNIANVLEFIVSSGRADQYWGKQNWYGGKKIKAWLKENNLDERDAVIGIGLLMIGAGCWFIYFPVALIAVGVGLFGLGTGIIKIK